jgi:hypothetical protein
MLTPKVREALQAELEHLRIRREHVLESINERIRALEAVLKPDEDLDPAHISGLPEEPREGLPLPQGPNLANKGLRESIRIVLSEYPTGLFPSDIASRLQELGFAARGHLPIAKRVYGELYRMRQRGMVSKRGHRYIMTDA